MSFQNKQGDDAILEAARTLINQHGSSFTMAQLEQQANTSRATIYRRIGTKEKLLQRLAKERGEDFTSANIRHDILHATRRVLAKEGLAASTMEQIATEAGVGVATIYRHFGTKEGVLDAFVNTMTPRTAVQQRILEASDDVEADLHSIVTLLLEFFFDNRDIFKLVLMGNASDQRYLAAMRKRSDSTLARLSQYFQRQMDAERLRQAGPADDLALALLGIILSFAVIGPLHYQTELEQPEQASRFIVSLLLEPLGVEQA
jgi:AcrR family transcriptional regulator